MRNRENGQKKILTYVLMLGLVCMMFGTVFLCNHVVKKVLRFQKNIIGVLKEKDEEYVQTYIHAMFEAINDTSIEKGDEVLGQYGYTDAGIRFIFQNMGMQETMIFAVLLFGFVVVIISFCFYRIMQMQKKEMESLRQENDRLREYQMKEEYISYQNKRIQSFIENIAHQMKTPLSRVYTSLDIVEDSLENDMEKDYVEECYQHLDSMNVLMRRLMDIGRLEAGKVIFQKELLHMNELLEEVKKDMGWRKIVFGLHVIGKKFVFMVMENG